MHSPIKLALADDCIFQQNLMKMLVKRLAVFDLSFTCNNGRELIDKLDESDVQPEICIMDLHMPQMGGIKTAHEIAIRFPEINVFGYTDSIDKYELEKFKNTGVLYIFSKKNPLYMLNQIRCWRSGIDRPLRHYFR